MALIRALSTAAIFVALSGSVGISSAAAADAPVYHIFRPTPADRLRELSTDRPDTTESAYSLDAGHFAVELSFVDYSRDRVAGARGPVEAVAVMPMLLKVGLLSRVDLQVGIEPYTRIWGEADAGGARDVVGGFGDTAIRVKVNLWGDDEGDTALAVMPYVSLPTAASGLGSGFVEGGVIVPFAISLPNDLAMGLMVELDAIRSEAGDRYVFDFLHTATVSHDLIGDLGAFVEYAGFHNLNADAPYRAFLDIGFTYGVSPSVQLDGGIRSGLSEAAEDFGAFGGFSARY